MLKSRERPLQMSRTELDLAYQYACRMRETCFTPKDKALWDRQITKIEKMLQED